jgi:hypothetical protein
MSVGTIARLMRGSNLLSLMHRKADSLIQLMVDWERVRGRMLTLRLEKLKLRGTKKATTGWVVSMVGAAMAVAVAADLLPGLPHHPPHSDPSFHTLVIL